jgi:dienelactone hydrolase
VRRRLTAGLLALCACSGAPAAADADDDAARAFWQGRAHQLRPGTLQETSIAAAWPALQQATAEDGARAVVVYLHGCDGIGAIDTKTGDLLASAGYLVLAPDSFARRDKPVSFDPVLQRAGPHREVLGWRHDEARYAIAQARTLPGGERPPLVLMGFSEGAIAVATYDGDAVDARVIEGWTCHAAWPEYRGLNAQVEQLVLALVAQHDPWFTAAALRGDCGDFMGPPSAWRVSIVFRPPHPAAAQHDLLWHADARRALLGFLQVLPAGRPAHGR